MRHSVVAAYGALLLLIMVLSATSFGRRLAAGFFSPFAGFWRAGQQMAGVILPDWLPGGNRQPHRCMELEIKVRELEALLAQTAELEKANDELRRLFQLPELPAWKGVAADVISRDPVRWNREFSINKGLSEGIPVGALVLSGPNVVGRIIESNRHTARAASLLSQDCRFSITAGDRNDVGICSGSPPGDLRAETLFKVDFLPRDLKIQPGQQVYTSGMGGGLPGGLPVGEVVPDATGKTLQIMANSRGMLLCRPLADLQKMRYVIVLRPVWKNEPAQGK